MGHAHGEHHKPSKHVSDVPIIGVDYFFLTDGGGGSQDQELQVQMKNELGMDDDSIDQARQEGKIAKCLIMRCHASKAIFSWMVPYKGDAEDGYVTDLMVKALKWFGYTRLIVKSDNEPALNRLVKSAIDKAKLVMPELSDSRRASHSV